MRTIKVGLLGCGVVGSGFVRLLQENGDLIRERVEGSIELTKILIRDSAKPRPGVDRALLTTRAGEVVGNGADIVVELIGGSEPARSYIREAIASRKHVVTANKAVLAAGGADLLELAAVHRVKLGFEASVCGAVPVIRVLREALTATRVRAITGVVNGTCNYILTCMEAGVPFHDALGEAQAKGFAEADPSLDLDGIDAAQKISILAQLAFPGAEQRWIRHEGIRDVKPGCHVRQVASARLHGELVDLEVGPSELPVGHPLAKLQGECNGVIIDTEAAGELFFSGRGAGSLPTASAVLSDVIEIARAM